MKNSAKQQEADKRLDWVMVLLMTLIALCPTLAIASAGWTDGLDTLWLATFWGLAAGVLISISRFRGLTAHLLSLVYSITWVGWLLMPPGASLTLREKIIEIWLRTSGWTALALRGGTGRDNMMFITLMALVAWWVAYLGIWNTVRFTPARIWRALLPAAVPLLINYYWYAGASKLAFYLILYLFCAFLVIVRSYAALQERRWNKERIGYNSDVRFDLLRWGMILALVTVALAWVAPTAATSAEAYELWRRVEGPWRRVEEDFNRMFSTLRSQARQYGNPFGRMITLRGPRVLTDSPVLQVYAPEGRRLYWRGVVYDRYTGAGWLNTDSESVPLDLSWYQPRVEYYEAREEITQTFGLFLPVNTLLFAAPEPLRFSVPAKADAHINRTTAAAEFTQIIASRTLRQGASYSVASSVSFADEAMLRTAGTDYPNYVRERYLQVPDSLPASVRQQARTIVRDLATPYDQAVAIEAWLRANVVYDDQTPAPPEDQDGVAYVLSVKRGYCDYYASAMVIMLRTLNVPARLVVGYAQGRYDDSIGAYHVTEKDSHSWVEVFFPKYGWIEFEPTAAQPVMTRPLPRPEPTPTPTGDAENQDPSALATRRAHEFEEDENDPFGPGRFGPINRQGPLDSPLGWVGLAGLIVALAFVALWAVERRRTGVGRATQGLPAPVAEKPRGKLQRALAIVARLSLRTWLGLLGLVEVLLAGALVLALTLGQPASPYLPNTTAQAVVAWMAVIGLLELLLLLALASIWIYERYGLRGLSQSAQVYARLLRFSEWLHVRWRDSQTPHERGRAFAAAAPAAGELIGQIVDNYTREQYSPAPPDAADAEQLWQTTSPLLWVAGVRQRLQVIRRRWDDFVLWRDALSRRLNNQLG